MADSKTERLLQVVLCLTQSRRFVTKDQLRQAIPDYASTSSNEAFERMFERDKNELRELGIPLETVSAGAIDDDPGYRIDQEAYGLPPLMLTREELTAVALAARVWREQGPASAAARALLKVSSEGTDVDASELPAIEPRLSGGEAAFEPLTTAVARRRAVTFDYRTVRDPAPATRHLQPWGVVSQRGRWYVVGHDTVRGAVRVFRLSRIEGPVRAAGPEGAYEVPSDVSVRDQVHAFATAGTRSTALIQVQAGAGHGLRRRAASVEPAGPGEDLLTVAYSDSGALAEEVASYGAAVLVLEPADLRAAVVSRLKAARAAHAESARQVASP
jgi:proteasome accessory factor B